LVASLKSGLADGVYTGKYRTVTEEDNGIIDGEFQFGVNAPVPADSAKPREKEAGGDEEGANGEEGAGEAGTGGEEHGDAMASGPGTLPNTGAADLPSPLPMLLGGLLLVGGGLVLRQRGAASPKS
jgi:hypothetical protein